MLMIGYQLRAARALVGMGQSELASRAGVNINTIVAMEKKGNGTLTSGLDKIRAVMKVLEQSGVEFLNHGQPGVRLGRNTPDHVVRYENRMLENQWNDTAPDE